MTKRSDRILQGMAEQLGARGALRLLLNMCEKCDEAEQGRGDWPRGPSPELTHALAHLSAEDVEIYEAARRRVRWVLDALPERRMRVAVLLQQGSGAIEVIHVIEDARPTVARAIERGNWRVEQAGADDDPEALRSLVEFEAHASAKLDQAWSKARATLADLVTGNPLTEYAAVLAEVEIAAGGPDHVPDYLREPLRMLAELRTLAQRAVDSADGGALGYRMGAGLTLPTDPTLDEWHAMQRAKRSAPVQPDA